MPDANGGTADEGEGARRSRIGGNIRRTRLARAMSQSEAADAADISQSALSRYEQGKQEPTLGAACRLAAAFGVSLQGMLNGNEHPAAGARKADGRRFFALKLGRARFARGMTQRELAARTGISASSLSYYEQSDRDIPLGIALDLAASLDVPLRELLDGREERPTR